MSIHTDIKRDNNTDRITDHTLATHNDCHSDSVQIDNNNAETDINQYKRDLLLKYAVLSNTSIHNFEILRIDRCFPQI